MRLTRLLGHKHSNKHLSEYVYIGFLLACFVLVSVTPLPVLAFEAELASSPSQKLVAQTKLQGSDTVNSGQMVRLPNYSHRSSGTLTAMPPVKTKTGDWQTKRLAYAPRTKSAPRVSATLSSPLVMEGEASYYSRAGCLGCSPALTMANGQPLDDNALTMAIGADKKHLVGHKAKVTNLNTGQSVEVYITDTGGFYKAKYGHRVADLTVATKQAVGMAGGVGQVRIEVY
jgi:rare lipoprotein A (peptidoglycan hydrolase)